MELANERSKPRIVSGPKEANTTQLQGNTAVKVEVLSSNINFISILSTLTYLTLQTVLIPLLHVIHVTDRLPIATRTLPSSLSPPPIDSPIPFLSHPINALLDWVISCLPLSVSPPSNHNYHPPILNLFCSSLLSICLRFLTKSFPLVTMTFPATAPMPVAPSATA